MQKTIHSRMGHIVQRKVVEIRRESGCTQRELAKRLGREHSFIARIEQGERRLDIVELFLICKACNVAPKRVMLSLIEELSKAA